MTAEGRRNLAAGAGAIPQAVEDRGGEDLRLLLMRYAIERLLYRLSCSPHRGNFVLKGAILFQVLTQHLHRPTRDLDLLGFGSRIPTVWHRPFRRSAPCQCQTMVWSSRPPESAPT